MAKENEEIKGVIIPDIDLIDTDTEGTLIPDSDLIEDDIEGVIIPDIDFINDDIDSDIIKEEITPEPLPLKKKKKNKRFYLQIWIHLREIFYRNYKRVLARQVK